MNETLLPPVGTPAPTESFADRIARISEQLKSQDEPQSGQTVAASAFSNWGNFGNK